MRAVSLLFKEEWTLTPRGQGGGRPERGRLEGASGVTVKEAPVSGWAEGRPGRNRRELTSELSQAELAQSVARVGVVV